MKCACGSSLFIRSYRASGWWVQLLDMAAGEEEIVETDLNKVRMGSEPKTMRCAECSKRAPNPEHED